jgi:CxxC motif-containing protein (DUF1111 family)
MRTLLAAALVSLALFAIACSTSPPTNGAPPPPHPDGATLPAPSGFDGQSNGVADAATHQADQGAFDQFEAVADGLGPLFNAQSCRECHQNPLSGGASQVLELRVGHKGGDGSFQNPEIPINHGTVIIKGRSLVNQRAICPNGAFPANEIQERVPDSENVRTLRISVGLLGDGFVEALDDATLIELARKQCKKGGGKICGLALNVPVLESPGATRVGRFGWKDQHGSLLSFAADAYLNEIGITNRLMPEEVTDLCNTVKEPNDTPGPDGLADIDRFARFMRASKAPARDAQQAATAPARRGEALFGEIGCDACHVPTLTTAPAGTPVNGGKFPIPEALANKTFHPYSDFLLHDVGTGDGIVIAMEEHYGKHMYDVKWQNFSLDTYRSSANRMRTAPLWGVRTHPMLMHDGASLTFRDAITRHRGEASEVTQRFERLSPADQQALVEFLKSL